MTKQEYAEYEATVAEFMKKEGIANLSTGWNACPECEEPFEDGCCTSCGKNKDEFPLEPFFAWNSCECCGMSNGNFYPANGYNPTTKEVHEFDRICENCQYYAENGRLDDMTMMEIEKQ